MAKNDGGPAFPTDPDKHVDYTGARYPEFSGMSLRDWFAGQALTGQLAAAADPETIRATVRIADANELSVDQALARMSYEVADAMLAERARTAGESDR